MPARAAQTLPSFWRSRELLAVPYFSALEHELAGPAANGEAVCRAAALPICAGAGLANAIASELG